MGTLCIDIGNTRCKLALFEGEALRQFRLSGHDELPATVRQLAESHCFDLCLYSAVGRGADALESALHALACPCRRLHAGLPGLPVSVDYATPRTLGSDRLAAAVGARTLWPASDVLIADFGTCATFDLLTADGHLRGGNIAPGLRLRLAAMHRGTQALPEVEPCTAEGSGLLGTDTPSAMQKGAWQGLVFETEGYFARLKARHTGLRLLLTGGEAEIVRSQLSPEAAKAAAVEPDLVLIGLRAAAEAVRKSPHTQ